MSIWNIERSPVTGELCFVQPDNAGRFDQVWDIATLMSLNQAQMAGIEVPAIGNFGAFENCLVFWDNTKSPLDFTKD